MFNAQQTRRILDRLVGYQISPLLWKKIGRGLSAGRVQSIALRLIVEREKEILAFVPEEYWTIFAHLDAATSAAVPGRPVQDRREEGQDPERGRRPTRSSPTSRRPSSSSTRSRSRRRSEIPPPPYITSTLQQEAFRLLRYPVKRTMSIAQKLYEGMPIGERGPVGLITYMRTDSVRVSPEAQAWARAYIEKRFSAAPRPGPSARLQEQEPGPGRPRGRPADDLRPLARRRQAVSQAGGIPPLPADLEPVPGLPDEPGRRRGDRVRDHGRPTTSSSVKGEVMKFAGYWALYPNRENGDKETLPPATAGEKLALTARDRAQAELHPAAGPLHRRHAGQGARGQGHRPAVDLRADHRHDPEPDLRRSRTRASSSRPTSGSSSPISWSRTSPT